MEKNKFEEYLKDRYDDQIKWYSDRASRNKRAYTVFQWTVIVLSAAMPVLVVAVPKTWEWLTVCLAIGLAVCTAALKAFKFQENWISYRTISETLKKEKHYYDARLDSYADSEDREGLFVQRVEDLISREHSLWVTTHTRKDEEEKGNGKKHKTTARRY